MPTKTERQITRDKNIALILEKITAIEKKLGLKGEENERKESESTKKTGWFSSKEESDGASD